MRLLPMILAASLYIGGGADDLWRGRDLTAVCFPAAGACVPLLPLRGFVLLCLAKYDHI